MKATVLIGLAILLLGACFADGDLLRGLVRLGVGVLLLAGAWAFRYTGLRAREDAENERKRVEFLRWVDGDAAKALDAISADRVG